jgi:hypothetical protein
VAGDGERELAPVAEEEDMSWEEGEAHGAGDSEVVQMKPKAARIQSVIYDRRQGQVTVHFSTFALNASTRLKHTHTQLQ